MLFQSSMKDIKRIRELFEESLPVFNAMGDPIRQRLIMLMMEGKRKSVAELAQQTSLSRPTISHHLKVLKEAHIVASEKVGTKIYYCPQMGDYIKPIAELVNLVATIEKRKGK